MLGIAEMERIASNCRMFMEAYKIDNGRYPLQLAEIWRPDGGRLEPEERGLDAWFRPLMYWVSDDGQDAVIYSIGPNGVDERGSGDDYVIRFGNPPGDATSRAWPAVTPPTAP